MCESLHVAVKMYINYSFLHLYFLESTHWSTFCRWQFVSIFIQFFFWTGAARLFYFYLVPIESTFWPFKVIQGRWIWCHSKAHMRLPISP